MNFFESLFQPRIDPEVSALREVVGQLEDNEWMLKERLAELEASLYEEGWQRLASDSNREFSREGLGRIMALSRLMFLKNPLINRAVTLQAIYVWGQGCAITSTDEATQTLIDEFIADPRNAVELTGHQARTMKEQDLQVLGNLFFVFFSRIEDGATVVRTLPAEEVMEIITSPDDAKEPWFYKRTWTASVFDIQAGASKQEERIAYYPDFRYEPAEKPKSIGGKPVHWDSPVYHVRVGGLSDMRFGLPETYQAIDWAKAYKTFLENWSTIVQAYARFAWRVETKGGRPAIAAAKARLNTTLGVGGSGETNPPPQTASTFIGAEGAKLEPVKTAGATTSADDARRLLLMVCAAFGMPESFFGDVSVGTLATAKSLDRPTELKFRDRQMLWADVLKTILRYVIGRSKTAANGRLRIAGKAEVDIPIEVSFPPVLEHDVTEQMAAIVAGATLNGSPSASTMDRETLSKLILSALGVPNAQDVLELLKVQWAEDDARAEEMAARTAPRPAADPNADPGVAEAVKNLSEAINALRAKVAA